MIWYSADREAYETCHKCGIHIIPGEGRYLVPGVLL